MNWTQTRDKLIEYGVTAESLPEEWQWWINLTGADLRGAVGSFTLGCFGRHHAIAAGGYISIGCERHTYDYWLRNAKEIGQAHEYTAEEIADYAAWIQLAVARQRRIEAE